jgi:type II secretory pathway pseudopilin PulG
MFNKKGQSIIELLIVMALAALLLPPVFTGFMSSRDGRAQQKQRLSATALFKQTEEQVKNIKESGWSNFATNGTFHPQSTGALWSFVEGSINISGFIQQVVISDVFRDTAGAIVSTGGILDPSTKKIVTTISWTLPYPSSINSTSYFSRHKNMVKTQTTEADFDAGITNGTQVTNTAGGEVILSYNNYAKWCSPAFSSAAIDLPDGPPVAVAATANATTDIPNDVFVAIAPNAATSGKLAYLTVTANTDPPVPTLKGIFTLDTTKYSNSSYVPTGINLDNNFKTNSVKYYKSASNNTYALLATDKPDREVIAILVNDNNSANDNDSTGEYQDPVNKIYKYKTFFNTRIYSAAAGLDTGYRNPTANAADSGGDNDGFGTNPTRAYSDNASFAVDTNSGNGTSANCTGADKDKHRFYNYGFSLPPGSTVNGIEVRLDAKVDNIAGLPQMCVQLSWDGGTTWTTAKSTTNLTTNEATYILGDVSDTWGRTWIDTNFTNANFRLRVINVASDTNRDFSLDWAAVKVHYSNSAPSFNDQAPFGYGATALTVLGDTGYITSGGYLYAFDLTNIDSKSPTSELDQVGCRILLDGFDCNPGTTAVDKKYSAGETGTTWSTAGFPVHNDCSDGGNIELYASNHLSAVQVGNNKYVYVAVGAGTNPELDIVDVTTPPTDITNSTCGRGGNTGWKTTGTLDFNSKSGTEEAANSVYAKSDGTRAYMTSNGGIDANNDGIADSKQFYVINTSNKSSPTFLSGVPGSPSYGPTTGFYTGSGADYQLFPRRSLTVLNGLRAVIVGQDPIKDDADDAKEYQVVNISTEATPVYCGGIDYDQGFNDLTSVSEADGDNFVYMVANTNEKQLKIIQGGPDVGIYGSTGTFESSVIDAGASAGFNRFSANVTVPSQTTLTLQVSVAAAVDNSCIDAVYNNDAVYTFIGPDPNNYDGSYFTPNGSTISGAIPMIVHDNFSNPNRCFKLKASFSTLDNSYTPTLHDFTVNYSP